MKYSNNNATNSNSDDNFSSTFGITDSEMILGILRKNMYSDPIGSICREISSNARDAHREAGVDAPIRIHLPTPQKPLFKIRDFGNGITPERMDNVYTNYGNSTKRGDNVQTGGFGLGAKTPFAYAERFGIKSYVKVDSQKVIDEFNKNKTSEQTSPVLGNIVRFNYIATLSEKSSGINIRDVKICNEESTGLEVIIKVKEDDFKEFKSASIKYTELWETVPDFENILYKKRVKERYSGESKNNKWSIMKEVESFNWGEENPSHSSLVIDGIPYPINFDKVQRPEHIDDHSRLHLHFGVGEVNISAHRESVYYDAETKKKISKRIQEAVCEINKLVQKEIDSKESYSEAHAFFNSCSNFIDLDDKFNWKNSSLKSRVNQEGDFVFAKYKKTYYKDSLKREKVNAVFAEEKFVINNLGATVNNKLLQGLFEKEDLNEITVISNSAGKFDSFEDLFLKSSIKLKDLDNVFYLKDYNKKIKIKAREKLNKYQINCYKINGTPYSNHWDKAKGFKTDEADSYYCIINKISDPIYLNGERFTIDSLCNFIKGIAYSNSSGVYSYSSSIKDIFPELKVIGIRDSQLKKISTRCKPISEFFEKEFQSFLKEYRNTILINDNSFDPDVFNIVNKLKDSHSLKKSCLAYNAIKLRTEGLDRALLFYSKTIDEAKALIEEKNKKNLKSKSIYDQIKSKYPLLKYIDSSKIADNNLNVIEEYISEEEN